MTGPSTLSLSNAEAADLGDVPVLALDEFLGRIAHDVEAGARISAFFARPVEAGPLRLHAVLAFDRQGVLSLSSANVGGEYPSLTPRCPQAHWFEREIAEQWAVTPLGHPWLKPIRFHAPYRTADAALTCPAPTIGVTDFFQVHGEEIHEVAVGPVHAGIIEPGHFRFQCHGENVQHLEISLGYQHRGVEQALVGGPGPRTIHYMETLAGDTTIGHATAYCQAVEALAGCNVPARGQVIRGIALELERLANHIGDLGALAGDIGFLPTASYCGRIRGDALNMTALLCGSRFGRGLVRPGGAAFDLDDALAADLRHRLDALNKDAHSAVNLLWDTPSVTARFEQTGAVPPEIARRIGMVGPAARASALDQDVRKDFPAGIFRFAHLPSVTWETGDVFARAYVRWLEVHRSIAFIRDELASLPGGPARADPAADLPLAANRIAVSLVEGWRGEICHVAATDTRGRLAHYKVVDPSFHNWFGLALAVRDQQVSDFPLCNKSFNLSYCGHDL